MAQQNHQTCFHCWSTSKFPSTQIPRNDKRGFNLTVSTFISWLLFLFIVALLVSIAEEVPLISLPWRQLSYTITNKASHFYFLLCSTLFWLLKGTIYVYISIYLCIYIVNLLHYTILYIYYKLNLYIRK